MKMWNGILCVIPGQLCEDYYEKEIESLRHLIDTSNDVISNQLSTLNSLIAGCSVLLALLGICLGGYVAYMQNKVKKMSKEVNRKANSIAKLAKSVEETNKMIQNDMSGLYSKLRKEETFTLLYRLEEEPLDIANLERLLLSRDMDDEGYPILRNAYRNLELSGHADERDFPNPSYREHYLLQFFQHYMYFAIQDDDIRPTMVKYFVRGMECAYERDAVKTTRDLCRSMSEDNCKYDREEVLVPFLKSIQSSEFKTLEPLKDILENELTNPSILVDSIEKCRQDGVYLEMFGVLPPEDEKSNGS